MARDFCEDLIEKSTKLRERLLRDTLAGKSVAHAHLEETNELHLACTGFLDQLDADSCYFFRDTDAKMWGN